MPLPPQLTGLLDAGVDEDAVEHLDGRLLLSRVVDEGEGLPQRCLGVGPEVDGEVAAGVAAGVAPQLVQLGLGQPANNSSAPVSS